MSHGMMIHGSRHGMMIHGSRMGHGMSDMTARGMMRCGYRCRDPLGRSSDRDRGMMRCGMSHDTTWCGMMGRRSDRKSRRMNGDRGSCSYPHSL